VLVEKHPDVELVAKRNKIKLARSTNDKRVANEDTFFVPWWYWIHA